MPRRARLIKANMAGAADAEQLQIDASRPANPVFVIGTVLRGILCANRAVRDMDVLRLEVYMIEERFLHPAAVTMHVIRRDAKILVQVEGDYPREIEPTFLVHANQL